MVNTLDLFLFRAKFWDVLQIGWIGKKPDTRCLCLQFFRLHTPNKILPLIFKLLLKNVIFKYIFIQLSKQLIENIFEFCSQAAFIHWNSPLHNLGMLWLETALPPWQELSALLQNTLRQQLHRNSMWVVSKGDPPQNCSYLHFTLLLNSPDRHTYY